MTRLEGKAVLPLALILFGVALASARCNSVHTETSSRVVEESSHERHAQWRVLEEEEEVEEFGSRTDESANDVERSSKGFASRSLSTRARERRVEDNRTAETRIGRKSRYREDSTTTARRVERQASVPSFDRNSTDYYEHRRAVMEKFRARQREIAEKYRKGEFRYTKPFLIDLSLNGTHSRQTERNQSSTRANQSVAHPVDLPSRTNAFLTARNVTRQDGDPTKNNLTTAANPSKQRKKSAPNYDDEEYEEYADENNINRTSTAGENDVQRWGECKGKVVYQHNLLLGVRGPSNLNAVFEVSIQGYLCITCVETHRYNQTCANVSLDSGGRGHDFVKLKLRGCENEGFSYIVKVWAVRKVHGDCNDAL